MSHEVLRPFPYSHDGVTMRRAERGVTVHDLPAGCVPGLVREGFVRVHEPKIETQAFAGAPENQAIGGAPEIKPDAPRRGRPPKTK